MSIEAVIRQRWINYQQQAPFLQATITYPTNEGNLIQASLVTLITFTGEAVWSMEAYSMHQWRARDQPTDALDVELQVLLRNAPSSIKTCWTLLCMMRKHSGNARRAKIRIALIMLFPLFTAFGFTAASIFVVKVASTADKVNPVLIKQTGVCGHPSAASGSTFSGALALAGKDANDVRNAAADHDICNNGKFDDSACFGLSPSLFNTTTTTVPCPFQAGCLTPARRLDSGYLNSNDLRINAPRENSVDIRKSMTCAVLDLTDVVTNFTDPSVVGGQSQVYLINVGPLEGVSNYTIPYAARLAHDALTYTIVPTYMFAGNASEAAWQPSPAVYVPFADLSLKLVEFNGVRYLTRVVDPGYLASGKNKDTLPDQTPVYLPDDPFSLTVCMEQVEYRNPVTKATTDLLGWLQANDKKLTIGLNDAQTATAMRLSLAEWSSRVYNTWDGQAANALSASKLLNGLFSPGLPDNQTDIDNERDFIIGLINMQRRISDWPNNPWYTAGSEALTGLGVSPPASYQGQLIKEFDWACKSTLGESQGLYVNFLYNPVIIVVVVCAFLMVLSWFFNTLIDCLPNRRAARPRRSCFSTLFCCLPKRRSTRQGSGDERAHGDDDVRAPGKKRYKYVQSRAHHLPQLARMAVSGPSTIHWEGCKDSIPYRHEGPEVPLIKPPVENLQSIHYEQSREMPQLIPQNDSGYHERVHEEV